MYILQKLFKNPSSTNYYLKDFSEWDILDTRDGISETHPTSTVLELIDRGFKFANLEENWEVDSRGMYHTNDPEGGVCGRIRFDDVWHIFAISHQNVTDDIFDVSAPNSYSKYILRINNDNVMEIFSDTKYAGSPTITGFYTSWVGMVGGHLVAQINGISDRVGVVESKYFDVRCTFFIIFDEDLNHFKVYASEKLSINCTFYVLKKYEYFGNLIGVLNERMKKYKDTHTSNLKGRYVLLSLKEYMNSGGRCMSVISLDDLKLRQIKNTDFDLYRYYGYHFSDGNLLANTKNMLIMATTSFAYNAMFNIRTELLRYSKGYLYFNNGVVSGFRVVGDDFYYGKEVLETSKGSMYNACAVNYMVIIGDILLVELVLYISRLHGRTYTNAFEPAQVIINVNTGEYIAHRYSKVNDSQWYYGGNKGVFAKVSMLGVNRLDNIT